MALVQDALPAATLKGLKELYGHDAPGKFLKGKHGVTHFVLEAPPSGGPTKLAVLAHGISTHWKIFDGPVTQTLLELGYTVLRYDFYHHGFSTANEPWIEYTVDKFHDQLKELVDHVLPKGDSVGLLFGHSAGGMMMGLAAARKCLGRPVDNVVLLSPCFYKSAPLVTRLAEKVHQTAFSLFQSLPTAIVKKLVGDELLANSALAFGASPQSKTHLYPEKQAANVTWIGKMMQLHPTIQAGCIGIGMFFFREALLPGYREEFASFARDPGATKVEILWPSLDLVVPHKCSSDFQAMAPNLRINSALRLGHEAPVEDANAIATALRSALVGASKL